MRTQVSSTACGQLTGLKLPLIQWGVPKCNPVETDLQEHCRLSVAESCSCSWGPYWAVLACLTHIIPLQAFWDLAVGRPLSLVGDCSYKMKMLMRRLETSGKCLAPCWSHPAGRPSCSRKVLIAFVPEPPAKGSWECGRRCHGQACFCHLPFGTGMFFLPSACRMSTVFCHGVPWFCNSRICLGFVPFKRCEDSSK